MPFVHVELFEGRTREQKAKIAAEITEAIVRHAGAPKEAVKVIFSDMKEGNYYDGGEMRQKK